MYGGGDFDPREMHRRPDQPEEHRIGVQRAAGQLHVGLSGQKIGMSIGRQLENLHDRVLRASS